MSEYSKSSDFSSFRIFRIFADFSGNLRKTSVWPGVGCHEERHGEERFHQGACEGGPFQIHHGHVRPLSRPAAARSSPNGHQRGSDGFKVVLLSARFSLLRIWVRANFAYFLVRVRTFGF